MEKPVLLHPELDAITPTQFHRRESVPTEPGSRIHQLRKPKFDKDGNFELVPAGEVNIYDEIQSHAESCDINVLMKRYQNGDAAALSKVQGAYFDATGMPKTYAEMLNVLIDAENTFNALPLEERQKFDCNFQKWLSNLDTILSPAGDEQPRTTPIDELPGSGSVPPTPAPSE